MSVAAALADGTADLEPVATRHEQVANHRVRLTLDRQANSVFAVVGFQHAPVRSGEPLAHQLAENGVVINQQNGFH